MTLPGVTPFPPEFAARYRAHGYWQDRPLIAHFLDAFGSFADRVAVVDDTGSTSYAELAAASERIALNLLEGYDLKKNGIEFPGLYSYVRGGDEVSHGGPRYIHGRHRFRTDSVCGVALEGVRCRTPQAD